MAVRILHRWHQAPPHGAIEVSSDPIARSCELLFVGAAQKDIASGLSPSLSGASPPTWRATSRGMASSHGGGTASNSYLNFGAPAAKAANLGARPATWVVFAKPATSAGMAIAERSDNNTVSAGWSFGNHSIIGLGMAIERSSVNLRKGITHGGISGRWVTVVATYDGGSAASGLNIYLDGVLGTVSSASDGSGTAGDDSSQSLFVGACRWYDNISFDGELALFGIFGREWSASEVATFHVNPWILIQSKKFSIPVAQAAASTRVPIWALSNSLRSRQHV